MTKDYYLDIYADAIADEDCLCPHCNGEETECYLCEGNGIVPPSMKRDYINEKKSEVDYAND